jgi:hypothetical protein
MSRYIHVKVSRTKNLSVKINSRIKATIFSFKLNQFWRLNQFYETKQVKINSTHLELILAPLKLESNIYKWTTHKVILIFLIIFCLFGFLCHHIVGIIR